MTGTVVYLDASALVKLAIPEEGTIDLRRYLAEHPEQVTSDVGLVEVARAVNRRSRPVPGLTDRITQGVGRVLLDDDVVREASRIVPPILRTLDAIHLVSARRLGSALEALVTYDRRLAEAARYAGLPVVSPGVAL